MKKIASGFLVLSLLCTASSVVSRSRAIQYEHFTDFLLKLGDELFGEQSTRSRPPSPQIVEDSLPPTGKPDYHSFGAGNRAVNRVDGVNGAEVMPAPVSTLDIIGYFRDVPLEHWSCCMLGKLAGDKGFHCVAQFYAASIHRRNHNRAQNRRIPVRVPEYGKEIKRHFRRCVQHRSAEFHKCCYAASVERAEIANWKRRYQHSV